MSQQCALAVLEAHSILGSVKGSRANTAKGICPLLFIIQYIILKILCPVLGPPDIDQPEQRQWRP